MTLGLDVPWRRWTALLCIPTLLIGVIAYPAVHLQRVPLSVAALIVVGAAGAIMYTGQLRLLILLPVIAAYLSSLQVGFLAHLIALVYFLFEYGGPRLVRRLDAIDWLLLLMLLWTGTAWLANLGTETDVWSLPMFALTFLAPWLLLFVARAAPWTRRELSVILGVWLALAAAQLAPAFVKPVVIGETGAYSVPLLLLEIVRVPLIATLLGDLNADVTTGTTQGAHHLGVAMLLAVALVVSLSVATGRRAATALLAGLSYVFLMTDSKHVIISALVPAAVYVAIVVWPVMSAPARRAAKVAGLAVALVAVPYFAVRAARFVVEGVWKPYMALATINPKTQLVLRTGRLLAQNDLQTWIGHGPGSYATRAATIRASDVLFKEQSQLPSFIPAHTGNSYRSVAYDLYTSEIADQARYRSGALTNPFSSLVGIFAEYGLAGSVVVLGFFGALTRAGYRLWRRTGASPALRAAGAAAGFAVPLVVLLGVFDSYLEQPDITGLVLALVLVTLVGSDLPDVGMEPVPGGTTPEVRVA